jgi:hypothetical protein
METGTKIIFSGKDAARRYRSKTNNLNNTIKSFDYSMGFYVT